jgi:hypothetical protein
MLWLHWEQWKVDLKDCCSSLAADNRKFGTELFHTESRNFLSILMFDPQPDDPSWESVYRMSPDLKSKFCGKFGKEMEQIVSRA